ncbi:relaxosome protein [Salmonella enterica subsp. enterica serovar 4,[5],12:i:-]|nr:relaxosome protein [Salmonella enterica subsp. enterica serovar 4,[5],12:i:-]
MKNTLKKQPLTNRRKRSILGKGVGDREYAEVLIAITEYHRALLSRLMAD